MRRPSTHSLHLLLPCLLALAATPLLAQDLPPPGAERLFGFEFEFAGQGNRVVRFEDMPWENYERLMRQVVEHYGGNPAEIRQVEFETTSTNLERYPSGKRTLFRAEWTDGRGRIWQIVPEFVASSGYDGYELVTPPLDDPAELERVLERVQGSGLVREGNKSGVHLTIDGRSLVGEGGNARALANLIILHENLEPTLRRMFNPVRGGGATNRFARSLFQDHPGLLEAIDGLGPEERTRENLERIFEGYQTREASLQEVDAETASTEKRPWKYRSMNLSKILELNANVSDGRGEVVEFRMFDLADAEAHRAQAEIYRQLVLRAERLAAEGIDVRLEPRESAGRGGDWVAANTPANATEARAQVAEMIEGLGLEPQRFESLIESNVRGRGLLGNAEALSEIDRLSRGRPTHNGEAFTYGFELEGRGNGLVNIFRPTNAEVDGRWDSMSEAQRKAYYDRVVGSNHRSVSQHFKPNPAIEWLDPYWYTEGTGNWEIHSKVFESVDEVSRALRAAKSATRGSGKGFHLHMRDNGVNLEELRAKGPQFADFLERAGNWVWMERAARLRTWISMNTWSNTRPDTTTVDKWSGVNTSGRATLRMAQVNENYVDIEIRGLTLFVDDIERLARIVTEKLQTLEFGPWEHTDNRLETERSLRQHVAEYLREAEGRELTAQEAEVIEKIGNMRNSHYKRNVLTPFLGWENESSLSESLRRELRFSKEDYAREILSMANRVIDGRYGPLESFDEAEVERQVRNKVRNWARNNGLREGLLTSLLPTAEAERGEDFGPRRRGLWAEGPPRISERSAREVFDAVKESAAEQSRRGLEFLPDGPVADAMREGLRRVEGSRLEVVPSAMIEARAQPDGRVRITTGLLNEIDNRAKRLAPEDRPAFRRRSLGLILGHELAHTGGEGAERTADAQAVRILRGSSLARVNGVDVSLTEAELRETLRVFQAPAGSSLTSNLWNRLRSLPRYGTNGGRARNIRRTVRAEWLPTPRAPATTRGGLPISVAERARERAGSTEREAEVREAPTRSFEREGMREGTAQSGGIATFLEGRLRRATERATTRGRRGR